MVLSVRHPDMIARFSSYTGCKDFNQGFKLDGCKVCSVLISCKATASTEELAPLKMKEAENHMHVLKMLSIQH